MLRFLKRLPLLLGLYLLLSVAVTVVQVAVLAVHNPQTTAFMRQRAREAKAAGKPLAVKHTWIPLKDMPKVLPKAVIAAEDETFYEHRGFDWQAMREAWEVNEKKERVKRGGSTITQQLAKNLFLSSKRSYVRKAREAAITWVMELVLPKDRILELYLNSIEWGPGVFGAEEGARYHFGISARRLTAKQACILTAIIPAPRRYRPSGPYVQRRAAQIARIIGYGSESSPP
ncbi:MAG: monofunctional biosynthetic peptidoglycan transglycosylase [bacterium]|nr:monofunctional biosynthetic peptidoglycan transglycosylase [bacterium]